MIDNKKEIKTLPGVIKQMIEQRILDMFVCIPGRVEKYVRATHKADIQPLLKKKLNSGVLVQLPLCTSVPVHFYSSNSNSAFIDFPIKKDDTGILLFSQRSLDTWLVQGGIVDPNDPRKFSISDGIFIPGLNPFNVSIDIPSEDSIRIKNVDLIMDILPTGKIKIQNSANELIDVLSDVISELISVVAKLQVVKTTTAIGLQPFQPTDVSDFATLESSITALKEKLDTLKA